MLRANLSEISPLFFLGLTLIFIEINLIYEWMLVMSHKLLVSEYGVLLATFVASQVTLNAHLLKGFDVLHQTDEINSLVGTAVCVSDTILDAFYVVQNGCVCVSSTKISVKIVMFRKVLFQGAGLVVPMPYHL